MQPDTIRLIVNADDLGAGSQRDRGIFHAFGAGIVTSASLLANGPSFAAAARQARELHLPVGVHLNLSDGAALTGTIAGVTDSHGNLPGKSGLRTALAAGDFDRRGVREELVAQVARVFAAGLAPDHLDSHQHFQLFPAAASLVIAVAEECGIAAIRCPLPMEPAANDPGGLLGQDLALYRNLAAGIATAMKGKRLRPPDGLWGMPFLDRLDEAALTALLADLPPGTWELMVHPGYNDPASVSPFDGPAREVELAALLSPAVRTVVKERDIRLITFGDLPCAS